MNFIVNSTNTVAVRATEVVSVEIKTTIIPGEPPVTGYQLLVKVNRDGFWTITFETDTTLEGITGKAAVLLAALEG